MVQAGGKFKVCINGNSEDFGLVVPQNREGYRKPDGIRVTKSSNGQLKCEFMEWAGGFDGYWSVDAGDGHEDGLARATKLVWPDSTPVADCGGKRVPELMLRRPWARLSVLCLSGVDPTSGRR